MVGIFLFKALLPTITVRYMIHRSQWRHNERDTFSNNRRFDCLLNCWFRRTSKKTSKLRVTGLCVGNSPVNSSQERPVMRKLFPFDDVIMQTILHKNIHLVIVKNKEKASIRRTMSTRNIPITVTSYAMVTQITGDSIVCSTVCSGTNQRKHRSWYLWGESTGHRWTSDQEMFPFDNVIMTEVICWRSPEKHTLIQLATEHEVSLISLKLFAEINILCLNLKLRNSMNCVQQHVLLIASDYPTTER